MKDRRLAFSLVEVVLALGVVSFAIIAILGLIPTGLRTSHSSQDETRAAQIAQSIFGSLTSQNLVVDSFGQPTKDGNGHLQLNNSVKIPVANNQSLTVDLTANSTPTTPTLYADNSGQLTQDRNVAIYSIIIQMKNSPSGFDPPSGGEFYANQVTLTVGWPAKATSENQTKRDFTRVISKY